MQTTIRLFSLCLLILGFYTCQPTPEKKQPVDWVDPQIGSVHCRWFFYTPAALPMGMAKLAPTTNAYGSYGSWLPCGYDDRHTSIEGFAHFHELWQHTHISVGKFCNELPKLFCKFLSLRAFGRDARVAVLYGFVA